MVYGLFQDIIPDSSKNIRLKSGQSNRISGQAPPRRGPGVAQWLRRCATSRTVPGSIPGVVTRFFSDIFPSNQTMALGSTQPLVKIPGGKGGRCVRLTTYHHTVPLSRNLGALTSQNPLGLHRPVMGELYLLPPRRQFRICLFSAVPNSESGDYDLPLIYSCIFLLCYSFAFISEISFMTFHVTKKGKFESRSEKVYVGGETLTVKKNVNSGCRSPRRQVARAINFIWCLLIFVGPRYGTSFLSPRILR